MRKFERLIMRICLNPACKDAKANMKFSLSTAMNEHAYCSLRCEKQHQEQLQKESAQ